MFYWIDAEPEDKEHLESLGIIVGEMNKNFLTVLFQMRQLRNLIHIGLKGIYGE